MRQRVARRPCRRALWRDLIGACLIVAVAGAGASGPGARAAAWRSPPGRIQVPIWPGVPPDPPSMPGPETAEQGGVTNVTQPTLTLYPPTGKHTRVAIVVFPGGGFQNLAMDLEGTEICDWITSMGVACALLKYRVPSLPYVWRCDCRPRNHALSIPSLEDAQRALRLVRAHAAGWGIDPREIGVIGFSAGGFLVAEVSTWFDARLYTPVDAADRLSSRPDFAIALYPGHLAVAKDSIALAPAIASHITPRTPPTFLLQNEDDHVDSIEDALSYYMGLKKAGVPVVLHAYAQGGHAFGLRATRLPVGRWPGLVEQWLHTIGVLAAPAAASGARTRTNDAPPAAAP